MRMHKDDSSGPDVDQDTAQQATMTVRRQVLKQAATLIDGDRQHDYGDPGENFQRLADLWNAYLSPVKPMTAVDVAIMLGLLKISRLAHQPTHGDSHVDLAGYAGLAGELATRLDASTGRVV